MPLTLRDALSDPVFLRTQPELVSGKDQLDRHIRWIYTHERQDIAQFLSGGELLIIDGTELIRSSDDETFREYVRSLSSVGIAALAFELLGPFTTLPEALLDEARRCGLPVIEIHRRVTFVALSESLNTRIVQMNAREAQHLDVLSHSFERVLARVLTHQQLAEAIADFSAFSASAVSVRDLAGVTLGAVGSAKESGPSYGAAVRVGNVPLGSLQLERDADAPAGAPSIVREEQHLHLVGTAMLRISPPTLRDQELAELLTEPFSAEYLTPASPFQVMYTWERLGLKESDWAVGMCARFADPLRGVTALLEVLQSVAGEGSVVSYCLGDELRALVVWPSGVARVDRSTLTAACAGVAERFRAVIAVGRGGSGGPSLLEELRLPRLTASLFSTELGAVVDVDHAALARFVSSLHSGQSIDSLAKESLGPLLDPENRVLWQTALAYTRALANKTKAAADLGIRRQTLYNRLTAIALLLGFDLADQQAWLSVVVAVSLYSEQQRVRSVKELPHP